MRYFYKLLKQTRTCRNFEENEPISEDALIAIVSLCRQTPSAMNLQELKFAYTNDKEMCDKLTDITRWGGYLKEKVPYVGKNPTGYIVICHDTSIRKDFCDVDVGICAQTMALGARELGYASCMLQSFVPEQLAHMIHLPEGIVPRLVMAFGKPGEKAEIVTAADGNIRYYRNKDDIHIVPKRSVGEIIISIEKRDPADNF